MFHAPRLLRSLFLSLNSPVHKIHKRVHSHLVAVLVCYRKRNTGKYRPPNPDGMVGYKYRPNLYFAPFHLDLVAYIFQKIHSLGHYASLEGQAGNLCKKKMEIDSYIFAVILDLL